MTMIDDDVDNDDDNDDNDDDYNGASSLVSDRVGSGSQVWLVDLESLNPTTTCEEAPISIIIIIINIIIIIIIITNIIIIMISQP